MAPEIDCQDLDDTVDVVLGSLRARRVVLIIDPASAGDLVVDCLRVSRPLRAVVLALHHRRRPDPRVLAWCESHVIPELLGVFQPDPLRKGVPAFEILPMHQDAKLWLTGRAATRSPCGNMRTVGTGLRVRQDARPRRSPRRARR
jgi:hypothetical protein